MEEALAGCLLAHACYTDLRRRVIRNWAVAAAAAAGAACMFAGHGVAGLRISAEGAAVGAVWLLAVAGLGLGPGDAKLAVAVGAVLGPEAAMLGPGLGYVLCAVALLPWVVWRRLHGLPWRGVAIPMAPWIALGTVAVMALRVRG